MEYYKILKDKWKSIESLLGKANLRVKIDATDGYVLDEIVISTESEKYINAFSEYRNVIITEQILRNFNGEPVGHYTIHISVDDVKGKTPEEFAKAFSNYFSNLVRIAREYSSKGRSKILKYNIKSEQTPQKMLEEYIPFDMDVYY